MELSAVPVVIPEGANVIVGQSHFIKTVEDLYEAVVGSVPGAKFGLAFNEASGPCLVRVEGNDDELRQAASRATLAIGAGHVFVLYLRNAFPINLLDRVREIPEVCSIFCASANPIEVVVIETQLGRGILGIVDGSKPVGIEEPSDIRWRKDFLRKIGYKL